MQSSETTFLQKSININNRNFAFVVAFNEKQARKAQPECFKIVNKRTNAKAK
jgi:hypothetical protein